MWLCSVSKRNESTGEVIPTARWRRKDRRFAEILIDRVLGDCGDPTIQRQFRMCVTACRHRATSRAERATLPAWFLCFRPKDIAGAPVKVLWSRGIPPEYDATRPCLDPGKSPMGRGLYLPTPCERCASRVANEQARRVVDDFRGANPGAYMIETS